MGFLLKFKPFTAPFRYIFIDPDTGREFQAKDKKDLFTQVHEYRTQNRLPPIQALEDVLEHYLCSLPENAGNCEPKTLRRGWLSYMKGGISLLENIMMKDFVSQEEADRRASICIKCPENIFPDKGPFLRWSDDIAENSTDGRKSKHHDQLGNCGICSCTLKAKVFHKGDMKITEEQKQAMQQIGCWQPNANEDLK